MLPCLRVCSSCPSSFWGRGRCLPLLVPAELGHVEGGHVVAVAAAQVVGAGRERVVLSVVAAAAAADADFGWAAGHEDHGGEGALAGVAETAGRDGTLAHALKKAREADTCYMKWRSSGRIPIFRL